MLSGITLFCFKGEKSEETPQQKHCDFWDSVICRIERGKARKEGDRGRLEERAMNCTTTNRRNWKVCGTEEVARHGDLAEQEKGLSVGSVLRYITLFF